MFIKNFGLFWQADEVDWHPGKGMKGAFRLLGRRGKNQPGLTLADFRLQKGIYILYDNHGPYYVGLTKKQGLGQRLKDHRFDRHEGQWNRFSWFGFQATLTDVDKFGLCRLKNLPQVALGKSSQFITDVEALLIRAMGLRNINQMGFARAEEWTQVKSHEAKPLLERVNRRR